MEGTGSSSTWVNVRLSLAWVSAKVWEPAEGVFPSASCSGSARPLSPTSPRLTGMTKGSLVSCPGVGAQLCDRVRV